MRKNHRTPRVGISSQQTTGAWAKGSKMKIEFILRVWHKETEELLAEVSSSSIALDDVRDLLQDVMPDDKELVAAVYVPKPGAEERLATLFGVDAVSGVYSLSREQV